MTSKPSKNTHTHTIKGKKKHCLVKRTNGKPPADDTSPESITSLQKTQRTDHANDITGDAISKDLNCGKPQHK